MEKILKINITNKCNLACNSCSIYASPSNNRFMCFGTLQKVLHTYREYDKIAVILEGGEPLLHPELFLFLEYLFSLNNMVKIQLNTNGYEVEKYYDEFVMMADRLNKGIRLCVNISTHILSSIPNHINVCKKILEQSLSCKNVDVVFNVRYSNDIDKFSLQNIVKEANIFEYCTFDSFKAVGRLKNSEYPKLNLPQDGLNWECYASDGRFFGTDIPARSEYEKNLELVEKSIPVFDSVNHSKMWRETIGVLADIGFKAKDDIVQLVETKQKQFIYDNINEYTQNMFTAGFTSYADYYVSLFKNKDDRCNDPFVLDNGDICARSLMQEFKLQVNLMQLTENKDKFDFYKNLSIRTAGHILHLPIKKNIKTTDNINCFCSH